MLLSIQLINCLTCLFFLYNINEQTINKINVILSEIPKIFLSIISCGLHKYKKFDNINATVASANT